MNIKDRKLNKEELELWKHVTKNDKKLKKYTKNIEEKKLHEQKTIIVSSAPNKSSNIEKTLNYKEQCFQVNKRMRTKIERGLIKPEAKLDLHGNTLIQAKKTLITFINTCLRNNVRFVLVITGKKKSIDGSKGLIRENLPLWLKEKELVNFILYHCYATKKHGDDGARYILLRKKDKVIYG